MLINFFSCLRNSKIPVSIKELLLLLEALKERLAFASMDDFYLLSRVCLVKDEKYYDRFDRAFTSYFRDIQSVEDIIEALIPEDWLRQEFLKNLSEEEKAQVESMGGLEALLEEFKKRLSEQKERHEGGNKWIGTGGTSPFGHGGYHPGGVRIGGEGNNKQASKVWEQRQYQNLDDSVELGTRNIKMALRKLRQFARTGASEELDLDDTIRSTARNAGMLDIKMVAERHNAVKVLLFFDVGGSMDPYVQICEELFSACRTEFKHLKYYYFHNFIYDQVWTDNERRRQVSVDLLDVLHTYTKDYRVIFIGDASMGPWEITHRYGSVEMMNEEPGHTWMRRLTESFDKVTWLNPVKKDHWAYTESIQLIQSLLNDKMYPLTLEGLDQSISYLSR